MKELKSYNPYTEELIQTYKQDRQKDVKAKLKSVEDGFGYWRNLPLEKRIAQIRKIGMKLSKNQRTYAHVMTIEMGKLITEANSEIDKCAWLCEYYADNAAKFLKNEKVKTDASESYVSNDPLGVVLGIMPWNYPFWQVFRFAVPTLLAGNTVVLKHASNVMGCAAELEKLFNGASKKHDIFKSLIIDSSNMEKVISDPIVKGISLTGSEKAGKAVAEMAGKYLKPTLLELGGNNSFIVLKDADLEKAADDFITGRFQNAGQSCIAAKRLLVQESIYKDFMKVLIPKIKKLKVEDPSNVSSNLAPMARPDLAKELQVQVKKSVLQRAKVRTGNKVNGACFSPTLLEGVKPGMPAFEEELFGPVAAVTKFNSFSDAIVLSNSSKFGLGVSIYSKNIAKVKKEIHNFQEGAVFINSIVKSDPRLPFGGVKNSGYGRELAKDGILAFTNRRTVYIND